MFIAALVTIAKIWKQLKGPSVHEWIKKLWYVYTMECYTAVGKKKLILCKNIIHTWKMWKNHIGTVHTSFQICLELLF